VLSIPLGLPKVIKQELLSYGYAIHVEKTETQERCPHCGFALPLSTAGGHGKNATPKRVLKARFGFFYLTI
jgi:hypothetical protein